MFLNTPAPRPVDDELVDELTGQPLEVESPAESQIGQEPEPPMAQPGASAVGEK